MSWISYLYERISGLESRELPPGRRVCRRAATGRRSPSSTRSDDQFAGTLAARAVPRRKGSSARRTEARRDRSVALHRADRVRGHGRARSATSPTSRRRSQGVEVAEGFLPVVAPASVYWLDNELLQDGRGVRLRARRRAATEYRAIVDAGFLAAGRRRRARARVRLDPRRAAARSRTTARWAQLRVDALNHALRGHPGGPRPLPRLLGQLARPARLRPAARRGRSTSSCR